MPKPSPNLQKPYSLLHTAKQWPHHVAYHVVITKGCTSRALQTEDIFVRTTEERGRERGSFNSFLSLHCICGKEEEMHSHLVTEVWVLHRLHYYMCGYDYLIVGNLGAQVRAMRIKMGGSAAIHKDSASSFGRPCLDHVSTTSSPCLSHTTILWGCQPPTTDHTFPIDYRSRLTQLRLISEGGDWVRMNC